MRVSVKEWIIIGIIGDKLFLSISETNFNCHFTDECAHATDPTFIHMWASTTSAPSLLNQWGFIPHPQDQTVLGVPSHVHQSHQSSSDYRPSLCFMCSRSNDISVSDSKHLMSSLSHWMVAWKMHHWVNWVQSPSKKREPVQLLRLTVFYIFQSFSRQPNLLKKTPNLMHLFLDEMKKRGKKIKAEMQPPCFWVFTWQLTGSLVPGRTRWTKCTPRGQKREVPEGCSRLKKATFLLHFIFLPVLRWNKPAQTTPSACSSAVLLRHAWQRVMSVCRKLTLQKRSKGVCH